MYVTIVPRGQTSAPASKWMLSSGSQRMFNVRPDVPWIHVRPDQFAESPPGFHVATEPGRGASVDNTGLGSFGQENAVRSAPIYPVSSPSYDPAASLLPSRYPSQEAFDQLARIYGLTFSPRDPQTTDVDPLRPADGAPRLPAGQLVGDRTGFAAPADALVPQNSSFFDAQRGSLQPAAVPLARPRLSSHGGDVRCDLRRRPAPRAAIRTVPTTSCDRRLESGRR